MMNRTLSESDLGMKSRADEAKKERQRRRMKTRYDAESRCRIREETGSSRCVRNQIEVDIVRNERTGQQVRRRSVSDSNGRAFDHGIFFLNDSVRRHSKSFVGLSELSSSSSLASLDNRDGDDRVRCATKSSSPPRTPSILVRKLKRLVLKRRREDSFSEATTLSGVWGQFVDTDTINRVPTRTNDERIDEHSLNEDEEDGQRALPFFDSSKKHAHHKRSDSIARVFRDVRRFRKGDSGTTI